MQFSLTQFSLLCCFIICLTIIQTNECSETNSTINSCLPACGNNGFCVNGTCTQCIVDTDCSNPQYYRCTKMENGQSVCQFKSFFFYPNFYEIIAFSACFVVTVIASSSGMGGGTFFVPALQVFGGFPATTATIFSQVLIFGSMATNFLLLFTFQKAPTAKNQAKPKLKQPQPQDTNSDTPDRKLRKKRKIYRTDRFKALTTNIFKRFQDSLFDYFENYFKKRPVVQYDCFCVLQPASLAGTVIGVLLNSMLPEWATQTVLAKLCLDTLLSSYKKGMNLRKKFIMMNKKRKQENNEKVDGVIEPTKQSEIPQASQTGVIEPTKQAEIPQVKQEISNGLTVEIVPIESISKPETIPTDNSSNENHEITPKTVPGQVTSIQIEEQHKSTMPDPQTAKIPQKTSQEHQHSKLKLFLANFTRKILSIVDFEGNLNIPAHKLLFLLIGWLIVLGSSFIRGSKKTPSVIGMKACSVSWWGSTIALLVGLTAMSYIYAIIMMLKSKFVAFMKILLKKLESHKKSSSEKTATSNFHWVGYDVVFNLRNTILIPYFGFVSGVVAATMGVGGGMIIIPVMNNLGLDPQVSASTSSSMLFSTTSASIIQYFVFGMLSWDYFVVLVVLSSIGALIGQFVLGEIVRRTARTYYIAFIMVFFLGTSFVLIIIQTGISIFKALYGGSRSGLVPPC